MDFLGEPLGKWFVMIFVFFLFLVIWRTIIRMIAGVI